MTMMGHNNIAVSELNQKQKTKGCQQQENHFTWIFSLGFFSTDNRIAEYC